MGRGPRRACPLGRRFGAFAYYCWGAGVVTLVLTALR